MSELSQKDIACILNMIASIDKINDYSQKFNDADSFYMDEISLMLQW